MSGTGCATRRRSSADWPTTGVVPELVGVFEQDGDLFVAEEDLGGSSLRAWVTSGMADGVVCRPWSETVAGNATPRRCRAPSALLAAQSFAT